ncbi:uncharacterized protein LOC143919647 [Arctopsyche grandis]|uniref:uncharacterized protein LOC143919647 n=1 Tax=Arctopsyche grandis TaxID=121162 RepID=UPI00406D74E5
MECRLCLCSAPPEVFVSIHGDPHPQQLLTLVRKGDHLPDIICHSSVNNQELLDSFRSACLQSDEKSRMVLIKTEEVLLEDVIWEDEPDGDFPTNISSSPNNDEIHEVKITSDDNRPEMKNNSNEVTHTTSHAQKNLYECDICHFTDICLKSFKTNYELNTHKHAHSGVKPHKCDICSRYFTRKSSFVKHMNIHSGLKPYKCEICSKSFVQKYYLVRRLSIHSEENEFNCDIRLKFFKTKNFFIELMNIHNGLKPHKFNICVALQNY